MIELLVTMGIFLMLTGAVLANYRKFSTNAMFANASEDVVLSLRQAQVYGAGTKGNTVVCGSGTSFECAYGVHFTTGSHGLTIFADKDGSKTYTSAADTTVDSIVWGNNISIMSLQCGTTPCGSEMEITFNRPSPDAFITDILGITNPVDKGIITLKDANTGKVFVITVTTAGQISIQ